MRGILTRLRICMHMHMHVQSTYAARMQSKGQTDSSAERNAGKAQRGTVSALERRQDGIRPRLASV